MSTYTDLHNRVKENLVVGYKPDDRITVQKVRFYNEENEYWGTFKGTLRAENIDIAGGTLSNVNIVGATLSNVTWPGGVDFDKYGVMIDQLSTDVTNIQDVKIPDIYAAISQEATARALADGVLSGRISGMDRELEYQVSVITRDLHREISCLDTKLTDQDFRISTAITADVELKYKKLSVDDNFLSDKIDDLRADLGREVYDRAVEDTKLDAKIASVSAISDEKDAALNAALAQHKADNVAQFIDISAAAKHDLEHDRHYVIFSGSETIETSPFKAKDYTVNVYQPTLPDAKVYYDGLDGKTIDIGTIKQTNAASLLPLTLKTYKHDDETGPLSALVGGWTYGFSETEKAQRTLANGYTIQLNDTKHSLTHELSDVTFELKPTLPSYHKVRLAGEYFGIRTYETRPSGECSDISAAKLYVDVVDSQFETFNKFNKTQFNNSTLSVLEKESERITYLGNNKLKFEKNIDKLKYIKLVDAEGLAHRSIGRIYEVLNGISGIISADDGTITDINVMVELGYDKNSHLARSTGFKDTLEENRAEGGGVYSNIILSAGVTATSADFNVMKVSELYKYDIKGTNGEGDIVVVGNVVPDQYNKTLNESNAFTKLSADISQLMWIQEFKDLSVVTLTKAPAETLWTAEKTDSEGNVLNLKFNGIELFAKVTSSTSGQIVRQKYTVEKDSPQIYNVGTCHTRLYKTDIIDLSKFNDIAEEPHGTWTLDIDNGESTDAFTRYTLNVDDKSNDVLKIQVPSKTSTDISREFFVIINVAAATDKFIKVDLVKADGTVVDVFNGDQRDIYVMSNKWSVLQLNEVKPDGFLVTDLKNRGDGHFIEELRKMIIAEKAARVSSDADISSFLSVEIQNLSTSLSGDIELLSASLSGEVESLSSSLVAEIQDLSTALSGDIDSLSASLCTMIQLSVENLQQQILSNDSQISDIYDRIKGGIIYKGVVYGQLPDSVGTVLHDAPMISNLFVWNIDPTHKYTPYSSEATVLSNGFMYYVNKFDAPGAKTHFTIEGLKLEVGDFVLVNCNGLNGKAISSLTSADVDIIDAIDDDDIKWLSGQIDSLSTTVDMQYFKLSADNQVSGNNIFNGTLYTDVLTANEIHANRLSIDLGWADVQTLSADKIYADQSYVGHENVGSLDADETEVEALTATTAKITDAYVDEYLSSSSAEFNSVKATHVETETWLSSNEMSANSLYAEKTTISQAYALSSDIGNLSAKVAVEDTASISTEHVLEADINSLSVGSLSTVKLLDKKIYGDKFHPELVTYISSLQDVLCLSTANLISEISAVSSDVQAQVISNDTDIETLFLSADDLSSKADELRVDINGLSAHYSKTLSTDISVSHDFTALGGATITKTVEVDQLIILDEVTFKRYRLTVNNGALNIKLVDDMTGTL